MNCRKCNGACIKKGKRNRRQVFRCKSCGKYQQVIYVRKKITWREVESVIKLTKEGVSIRSTSRILEISKASVQKIILKAAAKVEPPDLKDQNQIYEVDELRTSPGIAGIFPAEQR